MTAFWTLATRKTNFRGKMARAARALTGLCRDTLFPRRCPYCGALTGFSACKACGKEVAAVRFSARATLPKAGHALEHVNEVYVPFWYENPVRHSIWRMKYRGVWSLAPFYAQKMAAFLRAAHGCDGQGDAVVREICGADAQSKGDVTGTCGVDNACDDATMRAFGAAQEQFCNAWPNAALVYDCIVPVPTTLWEHRNRDNIPFALAKALGKELGVPVRLRALKKTRETKRQMSLSGKERLQNVKSAYSAGRACPPKGARVLLVDDVVTTGATLNECASALLAAGVASCDAVCVAASRKF